MIKVLGLAGVMGSLIGIMSPWGIDNPKYWIIIVPRCLAAGVLANVLVED